MTEKSCFVQFQRQSHRVHTTAQQHELSREGRKNDKPKYHITLLVFSFQFVHDIFRLEMQTHKCAIAFPFPFLPHSFLAPFFVCLLLLCPFRYRYRTSVFALRVPIRTLSISTNKSINIEEVCMFNLCVSVCCRCRR